MEKNINYVECCTVHFCQYIEFFHSDHEGVLLERARCFFHISHVYHAEGRYKESFMAALQELNTAERLENNFHEVCSYSLEHTFVSG